MAVGKGIVEKLCIVIQTVSVAIVSRGISAAIDLHRMTDARKPRRCQIIMLDERRLDLLVQVNNCLTGLTFNESCKSRCSKIDGSKPNVNRVYERLSFTLQPRLMACDLLDMVASQVGLHEKEYFGLSYSDDT